MEPCLLLISKRYPCSQIEGPILSMPGQDTQQKSWQMPIFQAWFATESIRLRVRALKARFRDQKAEFEVIRQHLRPGDIACDVGANKGSFTYWLSRWCQGGRVIAFEPQPELARALANVCQSIGLSNVNVIAKGVYSHSGNRDLFVPEGRQPGASFTQMAKEVESFRILNVPVASLDEYFDASDRIALLKIDVEGAEFGVLKGAERILRQHAPLLVFVRKPALGARQYGRCVLISQRAWLPG
jgi:FkbM family methyltransferase